MKFRLPRWLDNDRLAAESIPADDPGVDSVEWSRIIPFVAMHLACLAVVWVGISWVAVVVALIAYAVRMFAITGLYHRYFYPNAARQGFYWWEIDISYYLLKTLSWTGLIWDLKPVPVEARDHSPRRIHPVRR